MNSSDVERMLGTPPSGWQNLEPEETAKSTSGSGVYVIRVLDGKPVGRLKGSSDIVYIGQGKMEARSTAHTNVRADFRDKGWHLTIVANEETISGLEIARFPCPEPKKSEHDLLFKYFRNHLEFPPANNKFEGELKKDEKATLVAHVPGPQRKGRDPRDPEEAWAGRGFNPAEHRDKNTGALAPEVKSAAEK